jgi:16S rRNA (uracil1498-N3)-methyltransferase
MTPFYISKVTGDTAFLQGEEAHHVLKVMRKKVGDELIGIDGAGTMLLCTVRALGRDQLELQIMERQIDWGEKSQKIYLMISPLHKPDRFEWLIEKAVELGVTDIVPYVGKHTVKSGLRLDRMERIMIAALKQSMRSRLPQLHEPVQLREALTRVPHDLALVAHADLGKPIATYIDRFATATSATLLIGPEGDFAPEELDAALAAGFAPVSLGHNRLRSETAAIHLLGIVKNIFGF